MKDTFPVVSFLMTSLGLDISICNRPWLGACSHQARRDFADGFNGSRSRT